MGREQDATAPVPERLQEGFAVPPIGSVIVNVITPVGVVAPLDAVSVTVAVQEVNTPTSIGLGVQDTVEVVGSTATPVTIRSKVPWLASRIVSPRYAAVIV